MAHNYDFPPTGVSSKEAEKKSVTGEVFEFIEDREQEASGTRIPERPKIESKEAQTFADDLRMFIQDVYVPHLPLFNEYKPRETESADYFLKVARAASWEGYREGIID